MSRKITSIGAYDMFAEVSGLRREKSNKIAGILEENGLFDYIREEAQKGRVYVRVKANSPLLEGVTGYEAEMALEDFGYLVDYMPFGDDRSYYEISWDLARKDIRSWDRSRRDAR